MKAKVCGVGQAWDMAEQAQTRIWIVDDDPELGTMLQTYLEQKGYAVRWFADGGQLRARLGIERPELVVLDLMLPGDDGLTLLRRPRRWRRSHQRPRAGGRRLSGQTVSAEGAERPHRRAGGPRLRADTSGHNCTAAQLHFSQSQPQG